MARNLVTIAVWDASDGTNAPPKDAARARNDAYFAERLADLWMKDRGQSQPGIVYTLDRLPAGYSGWEKKRGDSKHVDRYICGHPSGRDFRSLNEAWPHFQTLISSGGSVGCQCVLCTGGRKKTKSEPSNSSGSPRVRSKPKPSVRSAQHAFDSDTEAPRRARQADEEGIPDYYRMLLDKVKAAGPEGVREHIVDQLSPDWRAAHQLLQDTLNKWQQQPAFVPRVGELVLFIRASGPDDQIAWDPVSKSLRLRTQGQKNTVWEAGVVTQLPTEAVGIDDLLSLPASRTRDVAYSGFRIEPLSEPGSQSKPFTSQHKYVPLHALRPFWFWRECLVDGEPFHPTIKHALTVTSSWTLIGKYSFAGTWPEATLFCRGMYLGPELVMMGDAVRLQPRPQETRQTSVSDVMVISSIRLRFVKLDEASNDDYDDGHPYTTCLHIAGKVYTLDPKRSFGGIGASPARPTQHDFPQCLDGYGNWFNVTDPDKERQRLEVPYTRVLGRCVGKDVLGQWLASQEPLKKPYLSLGLSAMREALAYSREHDARIDQDNGQSWFWAETRIEQLDLHEINGRFVGSKDVSRDKKQVTAWRQALKVLDGKKGGLDEYFAAKRQMEQEQKQDAAAAAAASSGYGMMSSAAQMQVESATDGEAMDEDGNEDDVKEDNRDENKASEDDAMQDTANDGDQMDVDSGARVSAARPPQVISLDDDDDDESEDELMVLNG